MKFHIFISFFTLSLIPRAYTTIGYVRRNRIHYGIKRNDHFEKDSAEESDGSECEDGEEEEE